MAIVTAIHISKPFTMADGIVYAAPARLTKIAVITSGGTVAGSNDNSTFQNITLDANKEFENSFPYLKCTGASAVIIAQPM